jgi:hypothetical protein
MRYVGTSVTDIAIHLAHDADVFVAVEQRVLVILHAIATAMRSLVRLKAGIGQDDDQTLGVFVRCCDGCLLLGDKVG